MQKNLTEDKVYKANLEENSMSNRFTKDDLIGRIRKGVDAEGKKRDLFWPKIGELRILGLRLPIYSQLAKFRRNKNKSLNERIQNYYGAVEIVGKKVYLSRTTDSLEELM
tara:strand:- start:2166 stop:2495 length:330 start_codon:yes stop_codon:yes gene_type:complete